MLKRFMIGLLVLVFPISLNAQTGVGSTNIQLEKVLEKSDKAPFEGVLVPYPQYYYYQEQVEVNFDREVNPPECASCFASQLWSGVGVFALGLMAGIYLDASK